MTGATSRRGDDLGQGDTVTITATPDTHHEADTETILYVKGASKEENLAYRRFLAYMEEKRQEARILLQEEEERKREAKEKEARWELL